MNATTIIWWEGSGWYAGRQDGEGRQTYFFFGNSAEPSNYEGYGTPEWWDNVPEWADVVRHP